MTESRDIVSFLKDATPEAAAYWASLGPDKHAKMIALIWRLLANMDEESRRLCLAGIFVGWGAYNHD